MAIFKCKMCGGALEINTNETVATCEYCGTQQTLPKLDDDRKANLYDRANHFRRNNEFDKAMGIYEQILNEDNSDAESYWSLVLCRYGIEYVEDPSSHKRVPTVNRAQFTSVFDDEDYKSALKYADSFQKEVYEAEAKVINEIQKGILAISQQEEPFDVFICYKETDNNGRRTQDSVIATELYHELTREGYKVFFSRITLEDKLGTAYEPYIFAALNSAKVMVVLGTKPEHFNAVWVKNEWSRYLSLIRNGAKKILIPAYRDMDPYDLPEEFSHLQAQDMSKLGFMQDLIRGIKKIATTDEQKSTIVKETVVAESASGNITAFLKRGFMALEDGEWSKADEFFEQALNFDAELAEAYLGKLMAELNVKKQDDLKNCKQPFDNNNNYKKILRFADDRLIETLASYIAFINERNHTNEMNSLYYEALKKKNTAKTEVEFKTAAWMFENLSAWKDSTEQMNDCIVKAEQTRKKIEEERIKAEKAATYNQNLEIYSTACNAMDIHSLVYVDNKIDSIKVAIKNFEKILGFEDADKKLIECKKTFEKLQEEKERLDEEKRQKEEKNRIEESLRRKKEKKIKGILFGIVATIAVIMIIFFTVVIPNIEYNNAIALMEMGKYEDAIYAFQELDGFKDSANYIENCKNLIKESQYNNAVTLMKTKKYKEAINAFSDLGDYKDSVTHMAVCNEKLIETNYNMGLKLYSEDKKFEAMGYFISTNGYKDSMSYLQEWNAKTISAGGNHTVAVTENGKVLATTSTSELCLAPQYDTQNLTNIVSVSEGYYHANALKQDGTVVYIGSNSNVYYNSVSSWKNIVAVSSGKNYTIGLKSNGTVVSVGPLTKDSEIAVESWKDIVSISTCATMEASITVGLKSDGTVVATGDNDCGQCNVDDWTNIVAVSAGPFHVVGLKKGGTVIATEPLGVYAREGQCNVSSWKDIVAISAGHNHTVGLKTDGTVVATGDNDWQQCDVSNWKDIVAISAGDFYTIGLKKDGTLLVAGKLSTGQCDVSDWTDIKVPN